MSKIQNSKQFSKRTLGDQGEELAAKYLEEKGYKILDFNYYRRWGEIDIIAQDKKENFIVFVEVKTRTGGNAFWGTPQDSVNYFKQRRLLKAAQSWLYENKCDSETNWRIDVMAIEIDTITRKAKINHIENAVTM